MPGWGKLGLRGVFPASVAVPFPGQVEPHSGSPGFTPISLYRTMARGPVGEPFAKASGSWKEGLVSREA